MALAATMTLPAAASADRAFTPRFTTNDTGDIAIVANTLHTCAPGSTSTGGVVGPAGTTCAAAQAGTNAANNDFQMVQVNADPLAPAGVANSSAATFALPAGAAVLYAGLYWGADAGAATEAARRTVQFRVPGGTYQSLDAQTYDTSAAQVRRYQSFRDVTSLVAAAGAGSYGVANVTSAVGGDTYAGWSLVVAYRDPTQPARNLTVFDGLQNVSTTNQPRIDLTGFTTPPAGTVNTTLGFVAYEGDRGLVGDSLRFNGTADQSVPGPQLTDAANPANDFFNSTIGRNGQPFTAKIPNYVNQLGYDADLYATTAIANNQTRARIDLSSTGDVYIPGVVTFATELYAPRLDTTKTAVDLNGGSVEQGDVIEYRITGTNNGQDGAAGVRLADPIPDGTTYVPGSLTQTAGDPGAGPRTDAPGDDQAEYEQALDRVVFRAGAGASATAGGALAPTATAELRFRVTVDARVLPGAIVPNRGTFTFTGQSLGTAYTVGTPVVNVTVAAPDLAIAKTHTGTAVRGGTVDYAIAVRNGGDATARGTTTVTDTIPVGMTFRSAPTGAGWTCTTSGRTLTCTRADTLAAGAAFPTIAVPVAIASDAPGSLVNGARVSHPQDGNPANDTASDPLSASSSADLSIVKTGPASAQVGSTVTFTLAVTNNGISPASAVTVTDAVPASLTVLSASSTVGSCTTAVSCAVGTLAAGASATITITATVGTAASGTAVTNTASVDGNEPDPNAANNSDDAVVTVPARADLSVVKSAVDPFVAGAAARFTFEVRNAGPSPATAVRLSDPLPAQVDQTKAISAAVTTGTGTCTVTNGTLACTIPTLAPGALAVVTLSTTLKADVAGQTLTNTASVASDVTDPTPANNTSTVTGPVTGSADLAITKVDLDDPVRAGESIRYRLVVTNNGPSEARGVQLADTLPDGTSLVSADPACTLTGTALGCALGTLAPGASREVLLTLRVAPDRAAGSLANTASVTSTTPDPSPGFNAATATTTITAAADVVVQKAAPAQVTAGGTLVYTLTVNNLGPSTAQDVSVADELPAGLTVLDVTPAGACTTSGQGSVQCALGAIAPNAPRNVVITARVAADRTGTIVNTATGRTTTPDPNAANDTGTASTAVATAADLVVVKTDVRDPVSAGEVIAWDVRVTNNGPSTARSVAVSDNVPASVAVDTAALPATCTLAGGTVTCATGDLAPGASRTYRLSGRVDPDFTGASIANTAVATSPTPDPTPGDRTSTATTAIAQEAGLGIDKSQSPQVAVAGRAITYTLVVRNAGPSAAQDVVVTDPIPAAVTIDTTAPGAPTCQVTAGTLRCALGRIGPDAARTVTLNGTVSPAFTGTLSNTATVASPTDDPDPSDNSDTVTSNTATSADLVTTKLGTPKPVRAGEVLSYLVTVTNNGPSAAVGARLTDVLPAGLTEEGIEPAEGCATTGQTVRCALGTLAPGASLSRVIRARVAADFVGTSVANTAVAAADTPDPNAGNNSSSDTTPVEAAADLVASKRATPTSVVAGGTVTYTLSLRNRGPSIARSATISDTLPDPLTITGAPGCVVDGQDVECSVGDVPPGEERTVTVTATLDADATAPLTNSAVVDSLTPDPVAANDTDTITTQVTTQADVVLSKTASPARVRAGEPITFTIGVTNRGPSSARVLTVDDLLPDVVAITSVTPGADCTRSGQAVRCTYAELPAGQTRTITVVGTVSAAATGTIANTATSTSATPDPAPGNGTASSTTPIDQAADLRVAKDAPAGPFVAGRAIPYTLVVTNGGPSDATAARVVDTLPAGLTFVGADSTLGCAAVGQVVTCDLGTLPAGASRTLAVSAAIAPGYAANAVTNSATVSSATPDPTPGNDTSGVTRPVVRSADLQLTKRATPDPVVAGQGLTYTLTVTNAGPSSVDSATLTDTLPAGLTPGTIEPAGACTTTGQALTCALGPLAPGVERTIRVPVTVAPGVRGALTNSASVTSPIPDPVPANNTDSATSTVVGSANLTLAKTATPAPVSAGEAITYTLTATNDGPSTAEDVTLTDDVPAAVAITSVSPAACTARGQDVRCAFGTLAPGETRVATVTGRVDPAFRGTLTNAALVGTTTPEPSLADNAASASVEVRENADLQLAKVGDVATQQAGERITYTLTLRNAGSSVARDVVLTDTVPAGGTVLFARPDRECTVTGQAIRCALGDLGPGATEVVTVQVRVDPDFRGLFRNVAQAETQSGDATPRDAIASFDTQIVASANLRITKRDLADPAVPGTPLTWRLDVVNGGPSSSRDVVVSDTLPDVVDLGTISATAPCVVEGRRVTCELGTLAPGAERVLDITGRINASSVGAFENTARVSSTTPDPQASNDVATADTGTNAAADLSVTKATDGAVVAGRPLRYRVTLANAGPSASQLATLVDDLPEDFVPTAVTTTDPPGACEIDENEVRCTFTGILPGGSREVVVDGTVRPEAVGPLVNRASADGIPDDPTPASALLSSDVGRSADLVVVKDGPAAAQPGGAIAYDVRVANNGPSTSRGVVLTDTVPGAIAVTGATPADRCTVTGQAVRCEFGTLGVGDDRRVRITGTIDPAATATLVNTATAASTTTPAGPPDADPTPADATDGATTTLQPSADVRLTKRAITDPVVPGSPVTYELTARNFGPSTSNAVTVTDTLDPALTGATVAPATGCTVAGQAVTCAFGALAPDAERTVRVTAQLASGFTAARLGNTARQTSTTPDLDAANSTATTSTVVARSADLRVTKAVTPTTVEAGRSATYTLAVTNGGPSDADAVVLEDSIPAGLTVTGSTVAGGGTCGITGQELRCAFGTVANAGTRTVTLTVAVAPGASGTIVNDASVRSPTPDPNAANDTDEAELTVRAVAALSVDKSAPATVVAGEGLSYAIRVRNAGPSIARDVVLRDALPAGFDATAVTPAACSIDENDETCSLGDLDPGEEVLVTVRGIVEPGARGSLVNTATAASPTSPTASDDATTAITASANLRITKLADPNPAAAGRPLTWTITVTNAGPSSATNVRVSDLVPAGVAISSVTPAADCSVTGQQVDCALGTLAPDAVRTITIAGRVDPGLTGTQVVNTASVDADTPDPTPGDDSATATTTVTRAADLNLAKSVTPGSIRAGQEATYTLRVRNDGPATSRAVVLTDDVPAGLTLVSATPSQGTCTGTVTCALGDLAPDATATVTLVVRAEASAGGTTIRNTARVASDTADPDADDDVASTPLEVRASVDLTLRKEITPDPPAAGRPVQYRLTVTNAGPDRATDVVVTDPLDPILTAPTARVENGGGTCAVTAGTVRCEIDALPVGASTSVLIDAGLPLAAAARTLVNTATVGSREEDRNPADNTATRSDVVLPAADLAVRLGVTGAASPGAPATWTFSVVNNGPTPADGVVATLTLPAGVAITSLPTGCNAEGLVVRCPVGTLQVGQSSPAFAVTVDVPVALSGQALTGTASTSGTTPDPDLGNNDAAATIQVAPVADLSVTKALQGTLTAGGSGTWVITATNAGPNAASGVTVTDPLPDGVTLAGATATQGGCRLDGRTLRCELGGLAPGASATVTVVGTLDRSLGGTTVTNTATVAGAQPDPTPGDNTSGVAALVGGAAATTVDLQVEKTVSGAVKVGQLLTFTIDVRNGGPATATGVVVTDPVVAQLRVRSASATQGTCQVAQTVRCAIGTLAPGASARVRIVVIPTVAGPVGNTASATSNEGEATPADNTGGVRGMVAASRTTLKVTKKASRTRVRPGQAFSYAIAVRNAGGTTAKGVRVCDALPARLVFRSAKGASFSRGRVCWTIASLAKGATRRFTISVRVDKEAPARTLENVVTATGPNVASARARADVKVRGAQAAGPAAGVTG